MSQENLNIENEKLNSDTAPAEAAENVGDVKLAVKKKRFKKSDILVMGVCIVTSVLIWLYASNLQKKEAEKEISKEDIAEVVESGMNKNTETAAE